VDPLNVYSMAELRAALHLGKSTIGREIREGRLRVSRRAGRYFILGEWVQEWLRAGEVRRKQRAEMGNHACN
jgi:hypothetical protein